MSSPNLRFAGQPLVFFRSKSSPKDDTTNYFLVPSEGHSSESVCSTTLRRYSTQRDWSYQALVLPVYGEHQNG